MQRILIIRFSSIGDIVLTTPVIRVLRKKYPQADIRFVTKDQYRSLVAPNPYLNGVFTLKDTLRELISELKTFNADLVVDLHHNLRTRILRTTIGGKWVSFNKLNVEKWLKVNLKLDMLPKEHIVDRYLKTLEPLGITADGSGLDFFFAADLTPPQLPEPFAAAPVVLVVGAKLKTKQLPVQKLVEITNAIDRPIVLIGGPEDKALGSQVAEQTNGTVYNACGALSLQASAYVIKGASVVITHDTGMMHIAAAFNKNIVSVWGNTIPEFGMYPYLPLGGASFISEVQGLDCRPCSKIGFDACPKGHFKCMEEQNMANIIERVVNFQKADDSTDH